MSIATPGPADRLGMVRRNLAEEERALRAGLAPIQLRRHLGAAQLVFEQLELFMAFAAHQAYSLEPLTYAAAWVFERRGFAYVRGHKLMNDIHRGIPARRAPACGAGREHAVPPARPVAHGARTRLGDPRWHTGDDRPGMEPPAHDQAAGQACRRRDVSRRGLLRPAAETPMPSSYRTTLVAEMETLGAFRAFVERACRAAGIAQATIDDLKLAVDEAAMNVVMHGYEGMDPGSLMLELGH